MFYDTFYDNPNLAEIPEGLFDKCNNVTNFNYCFENCTYVASSAWNKAFNDDLNGFSALGTSCFYSITKGHFNVTYTPCTLKKSIKARKGSSEFEINKLFA